jgi:hypothetical protein
MRLRLLASDEKCYDKHTCPAIRTDDNGHAYVTGRRVTDPALRAELGIGPDEDAVAIPISLIEGL